jgi:hypothetical protein
MIIGVNGKIGSGKDTIGKIIQCLMNHPKITNKDLIWMMENNVVAEYSKCEIKKFAGKLKQIGSILSGVPVEMFEDQEFKKLDMSPEWGMTYREFLQRLGTEAMRDNLHENVWINALFADYKPKVTYQMEILDLGASDLQREKIGKPVNSEYPNWIITDMRFPNEMEAVKEKAGITIRVVRQTKEQGLKLAAVRLGKLNATMQDIINVHPSETALDDAKFDYEIINDESIEDLVEKVREILIKENII